MGFKSNSIYNKIYKHQSYKCFYCNTEVELFTMEREHVFPRSKGGKGIANKVLSCKLCNKIKANLTIEEFKIKIEDLIKNTKNKKMITKYENILVTLNNLLNGEKIREGWHKKATYKSININKIPVRND